jgi:DNA-binding transcriptional LysR family regulator
VANGVGISLINPITAFDNLAATKDFLIKPFEPTFHYSFGLVYRQSWAGNQLIDHLKKHLPDLPNL